MKHDIQFSWYWERGWRRHLDFDFNGGWFGMWRLVMLFWIATGSVVYSIVTLIKLLS